MDKNDIVDTISREYFKLRIISTLYAFSIFCVALISAMPEYWRLEAYVDRILDVFFGCSVPVGVYIAYAVYYSDPRRLLTKLVSYSKAIEFLS
ncbi:MAG: hypothetical protein P8Y45_24595, partial [Exilibacterium sp.]